MRENGAAARLGLRNGDSIASIGGQQIRSEQDLNRALDRISRNGDGNRDVDVIINRGGGNGNNWDGDHHHHNDAVAWTALGLAAAGLIPWGGYGYGYGGYGYGGYGGYGDYGYGPYARYGWGPFWGPSYYSSYYNEGYYDDTGYSDGSYVEPVAPSVTTSSTTGGGFLGVILDERISNMAVVRDVYEDSPAEKMGLRPGDTVWAVNDQPVRSPSDLTRTISSLGPGAEVDIRFSRPEIREVEVTLDQQQN